MKKTTLLATVGAAALLAVSCATATATEKAPDAPATDAPAADAAAPAATEGEAKAPEGSCGGEKKAGEGSCGGAPKN